MKKINNIVSIFLLSIFSFSLSSCEGLDDLLGTKENNEEEKIDNELESSTGKWTLKNDDDTYFVFDGSKDIMSYSYYEDGVNKYSGNYRVVYEISDGNGRSVSVDYTIYTIESEPPELTISGKMPQKVKVGQKVTVPKGIAVDNASKNPIVRIYVIMPNRDMHILGEDRTFVADQAGQYVIRYYAYDDSYNYTVQNYVIIAE